MPEPTRGGDATLQSRAEQEIAFADRAAFPRLANLLRELLARVQELEASLATLTDEVEGEAEISNERLQMAMEYEQRAEAAEARVQALEREVALLRKKAGDWNTEADKYLAQRDELEREVAELKASPCVNCGWGK